MTKPIECPTVAELCTILDELPDNATWAVSHCPVTGRAQIIVNGPYSDPGIYAVISNRKSVPFSRCSVMGEIKSKIIDCVNKP